jgi:hypothetical protein
MTLRAVRGITPTQQPSDVTLRYPFASLDSREGRHARSTRTAVPYATTSASFES